MKEHNIPRLDLTTINPEARENIETIGHDLAVFDDFGGVPVFEYPSRINLAVLSLCLSGEASASINLKEYTFRTNDMLILMPGQIVQRHGESDDFTGCAFAISTDFVKNSLLGIQQFLPVFLRLKDDPCLRLNPDEVVRILEYHSFLRQKMRQKSHRYQREIALSLLHALFFDIAPIFDQHQPVCPKPQTRKDELFELFIRTVGEHYKQQRSVAFYADKLCLTPKHLSNVIKELTGKSASQWIDDYVVLEAKTLLKSTNLTILQISEELHFANQSFFGKYFKQHTGLSPMRYRRS